MNRKLFASRALATAIGLGVSTAFAGSFTALVAPAGTYAAEGLSAATPLTGPTVVYVLGVPRATSQNFTVIIDVPAADLLTCSPVLTGSAGFTVTLKRCSATQVAYDVTVTAPTVVGATLTLTGLVFSSTNLNIAGNSILTTWSLKDPGETSFIDNVGTLGFTVATSSNVVNVTNPGAVDTLTVVDVNNAGGPLFGFVVANDDTSLVARHTLSLVNNTALAFNNTATAPFDFTTTAGTVSVSISDTAGFQGLAVSGFCLDVNNNAVECEAGEIFAVPAGGPATLTIPAASFPPVGTTRVAKVRFGATGTVSLGTSRSFSLAGTVNPAVGAVHGFTGATNAPYATWSANATILQSPWFSTFNPPGSGYTNRFILLNKGGAAVGVTAACPVEAGNTATVVLAAGTSIPAGGILVLPTSSVCTFTGPSKGAVVFTINAPAASLAGTVQQVTPSGVITDKELERPFAAGTY